MTDQPANGRPADESMPASSRRLRPLPRNVELALDVLDDSGPLFPTDLRQRLLLLEVVLSTTLVSTLPTKFPDHFSMDAEGRIELTDEARVRAKHAGAGHQPAEASEPNWWSRFRPPVTLTRDRVLVLDIETTGLDFQTDNLVQVATMNLGTKERWSAWVATPPTAASAHDPRSGIAAKPPADARFVSPIIALRHLAAAIREVDAVAGHLVGSFDLAFLASLAMRLDVEWPAPPAVLDLHTLSLVVDPSIASRTLSDLADHYGIALDRAHDATHDVTATAELIDRLLAEYEPAEPSWALTNVLLARADIAWSRLMKPGVVSADLASSLRLREDPLARPGTGTRHPSATRAEIEGFATLAAHVEGFLARPQQRQMAQAVASTIDAGGRLIAEAPTGTGKSLAYLIPAAGHASRRGNAVVIATHTKVLQRQLRGDAERMRDLGMLPAPFRQLQGASNYLCTREIAGAIENDELVGSEWLAVAVAVRALATSPNGVWDDVGDGLRLRTDHRYRGSRFALRTTSHSCERAGCEWAQSCPLMHRIENLKEDPGVISANHALVAGWAMLAAEGNPAPGDVMAEGKSVLVFDEAHNLEDSLTSAWTKETGSLDLIVAVASIFGRYGPVRTAQEIGRIRQIELEGLERIRSRRSMLDERIEELSAAARDYLREFAGSEQSSPLLPGVVNHRTEFRVFASLCASTARLINELRSDLAALAQEVRDRAPSAEEASADRDGGRALRQLHTRVSAAMSDLAGRAELLYNVRDLADSHRFLHLIAWGVHDDEATRESDEERPWTVARLPIEIGDEFRELVVSGASSVVLTSATLAVDDRFDFLAQRLGIEISEPGEHADGPDFSSVRVASPFDHDRQSMAVLTGHLSLPLPSSQAAFCEDVAADQIGFLSLSRGRTLGLFAARSRMELIAAGVRTREAELHARDVDLLVQGEASLNEIERRFRSEPGTTVYGLASFWEGFDAPGETLSYLVIEKPPYPHPGDALVAARQRAITDRGGDPFIEYVVPRTAIRLAQGFGRLIRTEEDRGVALFADRRLSLPSRANHLLLSALPTSNIETTSTRDEAWTAAIEFVTGEVPNLADAIAAPTNRATQIVDDLRLVDGEDPREKLQIAARELFGIEQLHDFQITIMTALLEGHDVLGFVPTGSGKSLCFQLPSLLNCQGKPTVVVSPLVALIKDQVDELRSRRGLRMVAGITGQTTVAERTETLRDLAMGRLRLLYVSPERLVRDGNLQEALARQDLGALVVDEAHCVSSWGHDFRPEFRLVAKAMMDFKRAPRLGLTATATPEVEIDLVETLQLDDPVIYREPVDRPDLQFHVTEFHGREAERARTRELFRLVMANGTSPGLVYASKRDTTEQLAWLLRQAGWNARAYHAGLVPEQRDAIQEAFLEGTTQIVVATKAFGMGINKPDIGWVAHFDLPEAVESYAQEAGRAARDPALKGTAALFFTGGDIRRRKGHLGSRGEQHRPEVAQRVLTMIANAPKRAGDSVFDPVETAAAAAIDVDQLNVLVAWLEKIGNLDRKRDATTRAMLHVGLREPTDPEQKRLFFLLLKKELKAHPGQQKQIDFAESEARFGMPPDDFEQLLLNWSFDRLVDFRSTQRCWRVAVFDTDLHREGFAKLLKQQDALSRRRLSAMIGYASDRTCRRVLIGRSFGDSSPSCKDDPSLAPCDVCAGRDAKPPWHSTPLHLVPDPEELVNIEHVALSAVAWSRRYAKGNYGEGGLKAALLGQATRADGTSLGRGLLACPQFGAVRYVQAAQRRLDDAVEKLISSGDLSRVTAQGQEGRAYTSLAITEQGLARLEGRLS